jgi:hypothetical protein
MQLLVLSRRLAQCGTDLPAYSSSSSSSSASSSSSSSATASFTPHFARPGTIVQCTDLVATRLTFSILAIRNKDVGRRILSDVMGLPRMRAFDFRFVAWTLLQGRGMERAHHHLTCQDRPECTPGELEFVADWLESMAVEPGGIPDGYFHDARHLFRISDPTTAGRLLRLIRIGFRNLRPDSLDGLRVYHPCMTKAALRSLLWKHPLAAANVMAIREQHFRVTSRIWETVVDKGLGIHQSRRARWCERADANLREVHEVAAVVTALGGVSMSRLTIRLPQRAVDCVVDCML